MVTYDRRHEASTITRFPLLLCSLLLPPLSRGPGWPTRGPQLHARTGSQRQEVHCEPLTLAEDVQRSHYPLMICLRCSRPQSEHKLDLWDSRVCL
jgi:hypothetical protein